MQKSEINQLTRIAASLVREQDLATPFLFLDERKIFEALNYFDRYLPAVQLFYAMKANAAPGLIRLFMDRGMSLDVASDGEVETAIALGVSGDRMFLSTPMKTVQTIQRMFEHGVTACAVDTVNEIETLFDYAEKNGYSALPQIFVRVRVQSKHIEVDLNTKFGCSISDALELIECAHTLGFQVGGICFHVGTQSTSADNYFLGVESSMLIAKEALRRFQLRLPVINIGGGFCDAETASRHGVDLDAFYAQIGMACDEAIAAGFKVYAEPGRCLVSSAGAMVTSVIGVNVRNDKRWAYLNDGIYGAYSKKLYENPDFHFEVLPAVRRSCSQPSPRGAASWTVAGPTCDSLDVIAENVSLPASLESGDHLVTPNMGAYTLATASRFNGFKPPPSYLVSPMVQGGKLSARIVGDEEWSLAQEAPGRRQLRVVSSSD